MLREEGPRSLALRVLGELGYRRMVVMQRAFDLSLPDVAPSVPVAFAPLELDEVEDYLQLRPDADLGEIRDRLVRRHVCFVGRLDGRIVQSCWVGTERAYVDYLDCWIHLASGIGYLYDLYTEPGLRGRGLHRSMYPHMFRYFGNAGSPAVVAAFNPENRVQLIFARLGFRQVAVVGSVGVGPIRRVFERRAPGAESETRTFWISASADPPPGSIARRR